MSLFEDYMLDAQAESIPAPDLLRRYAGIIVRCEPFQFTAVKLEPYSAEFVATWRWRQPHAVRANTGCVAVYYVAAAFALPGGPA